MLLKNGAIIDLADEYGATPLMIASKEGHTEVVDLLIKNGAGIDLEDEYRAALLMIGESEMVIRK